MLSLSSAPAPRRGEPPRARVLIVDDSVVARASIGRMIEGTARFEVAGSVSDARSAMAFLAHERVDVVLLDIAMPGTDGLTALPELMRVARGAKVLIVSSSAEEGAVETIQALSLGAADTLVKPGIGSLAGKFAQLLEDRLTRLLEAPTTPPIAPVALPADEALPTLPDFDIVAIGASTGGIHALSALLRALPPQFDVPILITQHLPASFMPYFAAQLAVLAGRPCHVATDLMRVQPSGIVIAPGDAHLRVSRLGKGAVIRLTAERSNTGCMPSVDPMFDSIAEAYGKRALCVLLSGMGKDGSIGARAVLSAGGSVVVQDRGSSVVWGMPGSIADTGKATAILPPDAIGRLIAQRHSRR